MQDTLNNIIAFVPNLLAALAILIVGWLVALIVARLVRAGLRRTNLDNRLASSVAPEAAERPLAVEQAISSAVFYLILLFVLVACFQALGLTLIIAPLTEMLALVLAYLPRIAVAAVLLLLAWVLARVLRGLVLRVATAARLDERLTRQASTEAQAVPVSRSLAEVIYWLVFLLFLPLILDALQLEGLLAPVQSLLNQILGFVPFLLAAIVILVLGWFVARIVQRIISGLLAAIGIDRLSERFGFARVLGQQRLSDILGLVVYILILIPVILAALDALQLTALTLPISNMLNRLLAALPNILGAVVILVLSYVVGRVVAGLVTRLLAGVGLDTWLARLGAIGRTLEAPGSAAARQYPVGARASSIVGTLVLVAIMLLATINALQLLGFGQLADLVSQFLVFAGHVVVGLLIFALGLYLANLAAQVIRTTAPQYPRLLANMARVAILVLAGAMALRQMGLANEIINLAFGLLLGAIAVAVAVAFGLGGRELAGQTLEEWRQRLRERGDVGPEPPALPPETPPSMPPTPLR